MCEASVCAINGAAEHVGTNLLRLAEVHSDLSEISPCDWADNSN